MPYRRRRYNRRRRNGSVWTGFTRYIKKADNVANTSALAYAAYKGMVRLRRLVNVEKKKADFENSGTISTTAGNPLNPTNIGQGDTDQTRDGNSILVNGLLLKSTFTKNASATASRVRILIVLDKQQTPDTAPSYTDIIDPTFTDQILAPLNNETVGRYTVLMNRVITLDSNKPKRTMQKYFRLNHHVRYNGTASSDVQKGGLWVLIVSDEATNAPSYTVQSRTYFYDN